MDSVIYSKKLRIFVFGLIALFVLLPLGHSLIGYLLAGDLSSINLIFLKILLRSLLFGASQALASAVFVAILSIAIALAAYSASPWIRRLLSLSAHLVFVLPGTALALLTLGTFDRIDIKPHPWLAIVFAHTLWSVFFVAHRLVERFREHMKGRGQQQWQLCINSGASPLRTMVAVLWQPMKHEISQWFPLVLSWSFASFSTVLLLGQGPQHSTPEVLLYFTLLNDLSPMRIALLVLLNIAIQFWIFRALLKSRRASWGSNFAFLKSSTRPLKTAFPRWLDTVTVAISFVPLVLILDQFFSALTLPQVEALALIESAMLPSLTYAGLTALFVWGLSLAVIKIGEPSRRALLVMFFISPTILCAAWLQFPPRSFLWNEGYSSIILASLLMAILQLPLIGIWLGHDLKRIENRKFHEAVSLGMPPQKSYWLLLVPACKDSIKKLLFFSFVLALGEVALASTLFGELPTWALQSRRFAETYEFNTASFLFAINLSLSGLAYLLLFVRPKKFALKGARL